MKETYENKNTFYVIGLMSGTSQDGLDIAYCKFENIDTEKPKYEIIVAETIAYNQAQKEDFTALETSNSLFFCEQDRKIGKYFGEEVAKFITKNNINNVDFVASHGHTIFHQIDKKLTVQVGHGASVAAACNLPVVCDFRTLDVALDGQGAPLVPLGDHILFAQYSHCINLGGIANISFQNSQNERVAFDICPCNIPLNIFMKKLLKEYDDKGIYAATGKINKKLLEQLNNLPFYKQKEPKSLGKEWILATFMPIIEAENTSINDKLATVCEHIAIQIKNQINSPNNSIFITGGGAFNDYLISRIKYYCNCKVIIPSEKVINFKEALIFAWLGVLRWQNKTNTLRTVTGASKNSVGGCIYLY